MIKDARDDGSNDLLSQSNFSRPENASERRRQPGKTAEIRAEAATSRRGGDVRFDAGDFRPRWWPVESV